MDHYFPGERLADQRSSCDSHRAPCKVRLRSAQELGSRKSVGKVIEKHRAMLAASRARLLTVCCTRARCTAIERTGNADDLPRGSFTTSPGVSSRRSLGAATLTVRVSIILPESKLIQDSVSHSNVSNARLSPKCLRRSDMPLCHYGGTDLGGKSVAAPNFWPEMSQFGRLLANVTNAHRRRSTLS